MSLAIKAVTFLFQSAVLPGWEGRLWASAPHAPSRPDGSAPALGMATPVPVSPGLEPQTCKGWNRFADSRSVLCRGFSSVR